VAKSRQEEADRRAGDENKKRDEARKLLREAGEYVHPVFDRVQVPACPGKRPPDAKIPQWVPAKHQVQYVGGEIRDDQYVNDDNDICCSYCNKPAKAHGARDCRFLFCWHGINGNTSRIKSLRDIGFDVKGSSFKVQEIAIGTFSKIKPPPTGLPQQQQPPRSDSRKRSAGPSDARRQSSSSAGTSASWDANKTLKSIAHDLGVAVQSAVHGAMVAAARVEEREDASPPAARNSHGGRQGAGRGGRGQGFAANAATKAVKKCVLNHMFDSNDCSPTVICLIQTIAVRRSYV